MNQENSNKGIPVFRFEDVDRVKIDGMAYVPLSRNDEGYVFKREDTSRLAEFFSHTQLANFVRARRLIHEHQHFLPQRALTRSRSPSNSVLDLSPSHDLRTRVRNSIAVAFLELEKEKKIKRTDASIEANYDLLASRAANYLPREANLPGDRTQERPRQYSARRIRDWIKAFENAGIAGNTDKYGYCGSWTRPLDEEANRFLLEQTDSYLNREAPTPAAYVRRVRATFQELNERRKESGQRPLPVPSRKKIMEPIDRLDPFYVISKRFGADEAKRRFRTTGRGLDQLDRPLQRVEMDDFQLDLMSIFSESKILEYFSKEEIKQLGLGGKKGRWWLTVAICATTRCILGMRLSRAPSRKSAKDTLLMVLQEKSQWADAVHAMSDWHMHGWPELLVTDGGAAFKAYEFRGACEDLGIRTEIAVGGHPELRARMERLFRTMIFQLFSYLTGRTFANVIERGKQDPAERTVLTADDLNFALVRWAVDFYHNQPHDGLKGATPLEAWEAANKTFGVRPPPPIETLAPIFAKPMTRVLQGDGIQVLGVRYHNEELARHALRSSERKMQIRWYPDDIGAIWVKLKKWVKVDAVFDHFSGVKAQDWIAAAERLRASQRKGQQVSQEIAGKAINAIVEMNAAAKKRAGILTEDLSDQIMERLEESLFQGFRVGPQPENLPSDDIGIVVIPTANASQKSAAPHTLATRKRGSGKMNLEE